MVDEDTIRDFWQNAPVDEVAVGSFKKDFEGDWTVFFATYDRWRYDTQGHILSSLDQFDWNGKRVLEIGLGQGADSEQLIRRGARWSGIDLTAESVERLRTRLQIHKLPYEELHQGSALKLPFENKSFDAVYSHGVLHHIPEIEIAQSEIWRVLKPSGRLVMMVYARHSLNYHFAIKIIRRVGLMLAYISPIPLHGIYAEHKRLARKNGLLNYLKLSNFLSRSTDGPHNPYSKVYDTKGIMKDFPDFEVVQTFKRWMHAPPLPVHALPGERLLGWHLWAELKPKGRSQV